jgi:phospholipid/cholesterol/gamma-HCH transport system permease protein
VHSVRRILEPTGPVVTAILLAGRSGAAFAAELGTMKVNAELDALTTMGLDPIQFLVLQRVTAAVLLTPLLTLNAMVMGILGGLVIMRSLGFPPLMIYHQIVSRVDLSDFAVGITKAGLFALSWEAWRTLFGKPPPPARSVELPRG